MFQHRRRLSYVGCLFDRYIDPGQRFLGPSYGFPSPEQWLWFPMDHMSLLKLFLLVLKFLKVWALEVQFVFQQHWW